MARTESAVLGNALDGVPEESGLINDSRYGNPDDVAAEEKEEISEKVIDAMCEEQKTAEFKVSSKEEPAVILKPEIENNSEKFEENGVENDESDEVSSNEDSLSKTNVEEADDASNLEVAWEMFELAKLVYTKNFDNDPIFKNKRIAECLTKLGEISIEQELYEQALNDIKESIRIQEENKTSERDERMLAETYYQYGLAFQFSEQFELAAEQYQKAINILQLRIEKLNVLFEQGSDEFERNSYKDEVKDLESTLPEIASKLEEIKELGEQSKKLIKEAKECFINNLNANDDQSQVKANGEVKDITDLVKSKRKLSSSFIGEAQNDEKKTKESI